MFALITSRLGVHVSTTEHATERAARMAFNRARKAGAVDSGAAYVGSDAVAFYGSGR